MCENICIGDMGCLYRFIQLQSQDASTRSEGTSANMDSGRIKIGRNEKQTDNLTPLTSNSAAHICSLESNGPPNTLKLSCRAASFTANDKRTLLSIIFATATHKSRTPAQEKR